MNKRKERIRNHADHLYYRFEELICIRHDLEDIGCKAQAKKLDTIISKMEMVIHELVEKAEK